MPSDNPECAGCALSSTASSVCISGQGPANAEIMFVGEAPGGDEDARGVPFVGRPGQELNKLIAEYGFRREQVRVTNAVRCRPPDNREPTAKELKACRRYLQDEIRSVSPRTIVALGNTALRALTGASGIGKHRGSVHLLHTDFASDAAVYVTAHPSAALRYPHFREQIREDLALLRRTVDNSFAKVDVAWRWYQGDQGTGGLDPHAPPGVWAIDLETNARETRDPFSAVYLCAIDDGRHMVNVYGGNRGILQSAVSKMRWARERGYRIVGHNASRFDRVHTREILGEHFKMDDTMLMAFLLHEDWGPAKRLNLESLCSTILGVEGWKKDVTWNWRDEASIPWDQCAEYNARDTRYTRVLYFELERQLKEDGAGTQWEGALWNVYDKLLLPASRALADMEERGVEANPQNIIEARAHYEAEAIEHLDTINDIANAHGKYGKKGTDDFNPRSTKHVSDLLFERLKLNPVNWTDHGAPSTNVEALKTLREQGGGLIFDAMLKYRRTQKMKGTYIDKLDRTRDAWDRIFWWYSLTNTVTGRTSGDGQQIPREPRVRRCVGARPGKVILQADFSQLEMRSAASKYVFDEPNLREAFWRGDDVHRLLAAEITHKLPADVTKEERARAKPPNFLFLYGGEEDMYVRTLLEDYDIVKPRADATLERDAFFRRWNKLPDGHGRVVEELLRDGQVRSPLGTVRRLPNVFSHDRRVKVEAFRQAINFVDQSFSCHMALIGLVLLMGAGLDVRSFQHDAYLIWVDDNEKAVTEAAAQVRGLLEIGVPQVLASEFKLDLDVPLKVDVTAGTAWTDDDRLCEHGVWMPWLMCGSGCAGKNAA